MSVVLSNKGVGHRARVGAIAKKRGNNVMEITTIVVITSKDAITIGIRVTVMSCVSPTSPPQSLHLFPMRTRRLKLNSAIRDMMVKNAIESANSTLHP